MQNVRTSSLCNGADLSPCAPPRTMPSSSACDQVKAMVAGRIRRRSHGGGKAMSSDLDKSGEGTETVGQKLDTLSASVDERFEAVDTRFDTLSASVDERFDAVDAALIEQRQYTEFAYDRLDRRFDS